MTKSSKNHFSTRAVPSNTVTVLIGFAEALSAPEVAWSLIDDGFRVVAFARKGRRAALRYSRHVRVLEVTPPEADLGRAREELDTILRELIRDSGVPVALMPLDDAALLLSEGAAVSGRHFLVGPRGLALEVALNKEKQMNLARTSGFNVPPGKIVTRSWELSTDQIDFPVVFKPALAAAEVSGVLRKGNASICANIDELTAAARRWKDRGPMLLQQYIHGTGEGVFGLATEDGVLAWSGHRRVRMMNPEGSGSSACTSMAEVAPPFRAAAECFLQKCQWRGLFMIELLRDQLGNPWFIEFNGRPWGSMALARNMGLEYPAWAVRKALCPSFALDIPEHPRAIALCRHLAREVCYLLFVMRGTRSKALTRWPTIRSALSDVCRFQKGERWYNWRRDDINVFFADLLETLRSQISGVIGKR